MAINCSTWSAEQRLLALGAGCSASIHPLPIPGDLDLVTEIGTDHSPPSPPVQVIRRSVVPMEWSEEAGIQKEPEEDQAEGESSQGWAHLHHRSSVSPGQRKMGLKCRTSARKEMTEKYREQYTFWGGVREGGLFSLEPRGVDVIPIPSPATPRRRGWSRKGDVTLHPTGYRLQVHSYETFL